MRHEGVVQACEASLTCSIIWQTGGSSTIHNGIARGLVGAIHRVVFRRLLPGLRVVKITRCKVVRKESPLEWQSKGIVRYQLAL
jgi:hypothetical protein